MITPAPPFIALHDRQRNVLRKAIRDTGHTAREAADVVSHMEARSAGEAVGTYARTPDELEFMLNAVVQGMRDRAREAYYSANVERLEPSSVAVMGEM